MAIRRQIRIGQAVAQGGFGTVYKALAVTPDGLTQPMAIKVLRELADAPPEVAQRLRDEARMLGLIRHRSIVTVHDLLEIQGRWAVAMEFVQGADLSDLISLGVMPPSVAVAICAEVASALNVAFTTPGPGGNPLRMLHRDIKPGNIRLTLDGDVKILDFGAGRAEFSAREARTEAFAFGSMNYMAPERLNNFDSHAADIYSLGVVLFEMLTTRILGKPTLVLQRHQVRLKEAMDLLWQATGKTSEELVRLIGLMLAHEPSERPDARTVERLCTALGRQVDGPLLRDWAEKAVPAGLEGASLPLDGELTGLEITASAPVQEEPSGTSRGQDLRSNERPRDAQKSGPVVLPKPRLVEEELAPRIPRGLWGFGVLALALTSIGLLLWGVLTDASEGPVVPQAPPSTLSFPRVPLQLDAEEEAEEEPAPEDAAVVPTPVTRPKKPSPPASPEPPTGNVMVSGFAEEVWLVGKQGRRPPGSVPVGRYRVQVRFSTTEPLKTVATIDVRPGLTTQLNCSRVYGTCSERD